MPAQILFPGFAAIVTEGTIVGLTVIENVCVGPLQETLPPVNTGVTIMVDVTAVEPAFVAVKAAMLPEPLAARPIDGLLFVHVYDVAPVPEKLTAEVEVLLHTT